MAKSNTVNIPVSTYFELLLTTQDLLSGESVRIADIKHINYALRKVMAQVKSLQSLGEVESAEAI